MGCTSCGVACVCGEGLQLFLGNKAEEELFIPLSLLLSKYLVDPRRHNNLLRQHGCLRWEFVLTHSIHRANDRLPFYSLDQFPSSLSVLCGGW